MNTTVTTIPVDWVAHEVSLRTEAVLEWAKRLHLEHQRDDAGREWIAEPDGRRIIDEIHRVGRESAELHQAYDVYLEDWHQQQRQAGEAAFQRVLSKEYAQQVSASLPPDYAFYGGREFLQPGPRAHEFANEKAHEARAEWARKHPRLDLEKFERKWRKGRR